MSASTTEVGFIGLGRMGRGMAGNLLKSGARLTVFDTNPAAAESLVSAGATMAESVAALARASDVVFTSLPGPAELEAVVLGEDGLAANLRAGSVVFDTSTSAHALALRLHDRLAAAQCS